MQDGKINLDIKENLIEAYIDVLLDNMDTDTMRQYISESLFDNFNEYSMEQLKNEVNEYYPHILEDEA